MLNSSDQYFSTNSQQPPEQKFVNYGQLTKENHTVMYRIAKIYCGFN